MTVRYADEPDEALVKIAQGGDVAALAADADQQIEDILNS